MKVAGIILAAGRSSRLGRPKQLLPLGGKPLLQHVLDAAHASTLDEVIVVLGERAAEIAAALDQGRARVVVNERHTDGQSTSLQSGLLALAQDTDGAIFMLGDQPAITASLIDAIIERFRATGAPIVAPRYTDGTGNPVVFARGLWPELLAIAGDVGARDVLRAHRADVVDVPIATTRLPDVDTWEDYQQISGPGPAGHDAEGCASTPTS